MAASAPHTADAQFGRLKERAKERAKERLNQHAEKKVDQAVDKVVDESVARTEARLTEWVTGAFAGDAKVSEDGTLSRKGKDDVKLEPNKTGQATAGHLHFLEVTTMSVPGIPSFSGATNASEFFLYGNKTATEDASMITIIDLDAEKMIGGNHDEKTYWEQTFAETAEMVGKAMNQMTSSDAPQASSADADVDFSFAMDVQNTGITETVNGVSARKLIYIMEAQMHASDESESESSTKFFNVSETWISNDLVGFETYTSFASRAAEKMGMHAHAENLGNKLQGLSFMDARIGDAMSAMAEELAKAPGIPVKTVTYMVNVPVDKELDLDAVLSGRTQSNASAMVPQEGPAQEQVVLLQTTHYISNWSADQFDSTKMEIPSSYKLVESPAKAAMRAMENRR